MTSPQVEASQDEELAPTQESSAPSSVPAPTSPTTEAWGFLVPFAGNLSRVVLTKDTSIGRSKQCTIRLSDPRISAKHCIFSRGSRDIILTDLSSNGTFVNGEKIGKGKSSVLRSGDKIGLVHRTSTDEGLVYVFSEVSNKEASAKCDITKYYDLRNAQQIGTGAFSTVCSAVRRDNCEEVAVKIIDRSRFWQNQKQIEFLNREKEILSKVKHPNITSVYDIFDSDDHIYVVMELARGGELFKKILDDGSYSESAARRLFAQLLDAIGYLHSQGIVHRDLKPENILLQDSGPNPQLKITDFGLAAIVQEAAKLSTMCGTPQYVAPEILRGTSYGKEVDLWSAGAILYIMLSGIPPFFEDQEEPLFQQIMNGHYDFPHEFWYEVSDSAKDLVRRLMCVRPSDRMTVEQAKNHPWMTQSLSQVPLPIRFNRQQSMQKLQGVAPLNCSEEYQASEGSVSISGSHSSSRLESEGQTTTVTGTARPSQKRKATDSLGGISLSVVELNERKENPQFAQEDARRLKRSREAGADRGGESLASNPISCLSSQQMNARPIA